MVIKESNTQKTYESLFTVQGGDQITITPRYDVSTTTIFVDGHKQATFENLYAGEELVFAAKEGGYEVEIRSVRDYHYVWEDHDVLSNDKPIYLDYIRYDDDDAEIVFAVDGARIIHENQLDSIADSFKEKYDAYTVIINDHKQLTCYPTITTGKPLYFSCKTGEYTTKADISLRLALTEKKQVRIDTSASTSETSAVAEETTTTAGPPTAPPPPTNPEVELIRADNIELADTIKDPVGIPITIFTVIVMLSFIVILYTASHHNYHSKRTGTHHPDKKKKE